MTDKKIVFFEDINNVSYPVVKKYLQNNFTIYAFKISNKYMNKKIINLSDFPFDHVITRWAAYHAHKNLDYIFDKYYSITSIKIIEKLLKPEIKNMYKKEVLFYLEHIYNIEMKINEIIKNKNIDKVYYIHSSNKKIYHNEKSLLNHKVKIIYIKNISTIINILKKKYKKIIFLSVPIYIFFKKIKKISNNKERKKFKVGIMIDQLRNIFSMNHYFMELFLLDDNELPKEHVLFIDESGILNLKDYKKRGYNYTCLIDDKEIISRDLFFSIIKKFIPTWIKIFFVSFFEEPFIIDINKNILLDYIKWKIFIDNYDIKNYVKKILPDNISKTYILSQDNIKTWFLYCDCSSTKFHLNWTDKKSNSTLYSFLYYDNVIIYGDITEQYIRINRNFIKNYIKVGIIHSQIIHEIQEGKIKSQLPEIMKKKNLYGKIISVFDTSFVNYGPVKIKDGIKFGNDALKLLEDFPELNFIFKAKKEIELTPYLKSIYKKLKNHKRCLFIARYDKEGISAIEVIAQSDLVISAAYTSTTGEALGAKIRAIYYDPCANEIGNKYYFNKIPNFVAHNYDELKRLINYWLYKITDREFEDFLDNYVKNEMDSYLDCKAITRLRKLLIS